MSTKIKYKFTFKKIAVVTTSRGTVQVGIVEEYFDNNGEVQVTIKFDETVPKEAIEKLCANPKNLSIIGQPVNIKDIQIIEQPLIHVPVNRVD